MASVHLGRLEGVNGFARIVAIKRLHAHLAENREFADRFFGEARLASRVRHSNVVQTIDVAMDGAVGLVVMEYVPGEALGRLLQVACQSDEAPPAPVISAIMSGVLHGLHAAHRATNERGEPLGIVHRDVSPQNILVGSDGVARVLDFGIAKATAESAVTPGVQLKGKVAYMAPEQLRGLPVSASTDVFSAAIVLWESLVGRRLFLDETQAKTLSNVLNLAIEPPSVFVPSLPSKLDRVVLRGLERDPSQRFASAQDMAVALEQACPPASSAAVGAWVEGLASEALASRAEALREIETFVPTPDAAASNELSPRSSKLSLRRVAPPLTAAAVLLVVGVGWLVHDSGEHPLDVSSGQGPARNLVESSGFGGMAPEPPTAESSVPARPERVMGKRQHAAKQEAAAGDCTPPYTYNASGHKVFKPQCL
jgi:eukaryotic-like serine/threonine-protein kinase